MPDAVANSSLLPGAWVALAIIETRVAMADPVLLAAVRSNSEQAAAWIFLAWLAMLQLREPRHRAPPRHPLADEPIAPTLEVRSGHGKPDAITNRDWLAAHRPLLVRQFEEPDAGIASVYRQLDRQVAINGTELDGRFAEQSRLQSAARERTHRANDALFRCGLLYGMPRSRP